MPLLFTNGEDWLHALHLHCCRRMPSSRRALSHGNGVASELLIAVKFTPDLAVVAVAPWQLVPLFPILSPAVFVAVVIFVIIIIIRGRA
jgi:hypothetical protein